MRKALSAVFLILFYVVLTVSVLEIGVRIARAAAPATASGWFWRVPDANTGWSLQPNAQGRYFAPMYEYDVYVRINSLGLRADEAIGYARPESVFRILVLGDSFVEALQVKLEESLPQRLGQLYAEQTGRTVEVINAGVSGWGTDQQLLWLQSEGVKYSPDLILLAVYPRNDFMNNSEALETANQGSIQKPFFVLDGDKLRLNYHPFDPSTVPSMAQGELLSTPPPMEPGPLTAWGEWLHDHSALYRYADPRIRIAAPRFAAWLARTGLIQPGQETKIAAQAEDAVPVAYGVYQRNFDENWAAAEVVTAALFREVQCTADEMGAATAAILIAAPEQVYDEEWKKVLRQYPAMQRWDTSTVAPLRRAQAALEASGLPVLDLQPIFQERAGGVVPMHFLNDGHWTPQGHDLAARATFNFLASFSLLPDAGGVKIPLAVQPDPRTWWEWIVLVVVLLLLGSILWDIVKTGPVRWMRKVGVGLSTAGELLLYMVRRRQYTLLPLVIVLLLFAGVLILAQASVVGPFIYTLI